MCGGTGIRRRCRRRCEGLSPRVRGNLRASGSLTAPEGSIPACAGEPQRAAQLRAWKTVYPRVCGGTRPPPFDFGRHRGLSPRVRGNQDAYESLAAARRSIPACAGEPQPGGQNCGHREVYPRVCGGTQVMPPPPPPGSGLSPRVRGNRMVVAQSGHPNRSIPACAGEPWPSGCRPAPRRVYPRVCGGTGLPFGDDAPFPGLSPRVRGNHAGRIDDDANRGSIPACAGEP